jgi:hypothetical protein
MGVGDDSPFFLPKCAMGGKQILDADSRASDRSLNM